MEIIIRHKFNISLKIVIAIITMASVFLWNIQPVFATGDMTTPVETLGDNKEEDELEHLLFAKLVYDYLDEHEGETVAEYISDNQVTYSDEIWEGSGITYAGLYGLVIGDWEIYTVCNHNSTTGFYSVAFKNEDKVVIAFRGSEMFTEEFALDESNDWTGTDFKFALFNELSNQFKDADSFYRMVVCSLAMDGISEQDVDITLAGHSLGGALCAYESLVSGKYGYCFDGACGHIIDLTYFYSYLDIDNFTGTDDLDNIPFCNYTDDTGYEVADLIQHTYSDYIYQIDRETNLDGLNEYTFIPKTVDAGSHIIWSTLQANDGMVTFTDKVNQGNSGFTYEPYGPTYLDITKNVIETGMENVNFDTPWNIVDYENIDYEELAGSLTGVIKNGRVVLSSVNGGTVTAYDNVGVNSAFDIDTVMYGGKGDDHLIGYVADDVLIAGAGTDTLDGNLGNDTYVIDKDPGHTTTLRDIGGEKTTIILRNLGVSRIKNLTVNEDGCIEIGNKQCIDLDLANEPEKVEIYTYNNGKLRLIGNLSDLDDNKVELIYKEDYCERFVDDGLNILMLEGVGSFDIYDDNGNLVETVTNDVEPITDIEDACDSTTLASDYEFGMCYADTSIVNPSLYLVLKDGYEVNVRTSEKCNLAIGVVGADNSFLGCDRKYNIRFKDYDVKFDFVSDYGSEQGEVDWVDALVGGIDLLDQLFGN